MSTTSLEVVVLMLEAVELIVLEQDALLDHLLVWLGEEVVLLYVHLIRRRTSDHLGHIPLQRLRLVVAALQASF